MAPRVAGRVPFQIIEPAMYLVHRRRQAPHCLAAPSEMRHVPAIAPGGPG